MTRSGVVERHSTIRHVVTAVEFAVLWACLGLGPTPVALRLASPGRTDGGRHAVHAGGWAALRAHGLAGPAGPDPELARLVRLLAGPVTQMELRGSWDRPIRAVAAGGATDAGVLALRQDATVVLEGCGRLPDALATSLPPARAGPGSPVTVAGVMPNDLAGLGTAEALRGCGVLPADAVMLAGMLANGRGRAQVIGFVADRVGVLRRCGGVLTIVDTKRGRYLVTRDGADRCTIAPAGDLAVRRAMAELLSAG